MKLTEKQRRFADEYVRTGNIYQSAILAGYSENYAKGNARKLLENESVKAYIDKRLDELKKQSIAQQDEIMQFLTSTMRGELTEPTLVGDGEGYQKVEELKPSLNTRRQAAVDLGKRYSMWTEKQEITQRNIDITLGEYDDED